MLDQDLLTRRDLDRLFRVWRARAAQFMQTLGAELTGYARVLRRTDLLRQLRKYRQRAAYRGEEQRRTRLVAELRTARVAGIRVAVPVEALEARLAGLPEGVSVEPGRIEVRFADPKEAAGKLFALAQALSNDYERFEESSGKGRGRDERGPGAGCRPARDRTLWRGRGRVARGDRGRGAGGRGAVPGAPVLTPAETRSLLDRIDLGTVVGLRDRALLSVLVYSFARVSAAVGMRRQDYFRQGVRGWLRLHEKGGKRHDVPAHHRAEEAVEAYLAAVGLEDPKAPLFQSVDRSGRLSDRPLARRVVLAMIKRRASAAGLPASTCCHTFRATGITAYLSNGGTLEHAQRIAGHASPKTTKLYDRTADAVSLDEIERIVI